MSMRDGTGRSERRSDLIVALLAVVCVAAGAVAAATAQRGSEPATLPDVQKLGPQVGSRVPDFVLADQHGTQRTLASVMGVKGVMLVFYRSADW
jgi:cytochrome oxidase Cu insertion factor (SCO1/SenC/PrrC family)